MRLSTQCNGFSRTWLASILWSNQLRPGSSKNWDLKMERGLHFLIYKQLVKNDQFTIKLGLMSVERWYWKIACSHSYIATDDGCGREKNTATLFLAFIIKCPSNSWPGLGKSHHVPQVYDHHTPKVVWSRSRLYSIV